VLLSHVSEFRLQRTVFDDRASKRVCCIEKQSLQQDRALGLLQMENSNLRAVHSHLAAESASLEEPTKAFEQLLCLLQMEVVDLRGVRAREIGAFSAQFAQDVADLREQSTEDIAQALREQAKSSDGATDVVKPNFPTLLFAPRTQFTSVRFMANAQDAAVFFRSVAKDPDTPKQKGYVDLTDGGSQPRKADFTRCSVIFRLRCGSSISED
jgi:hypothetical protein